MITGAYTSRGERDHSDLGPPPEHFYVNEKQVRKYALHIVRKYH
jgi:hypothetical protein